MPFKEASGALTRALRSPGAIQFGLQAHEDRRQDLAVVIPVAGLACARAGFAVAWIWGWLVSEAMDPES